MLGPIFAQCIETHLRHSRIWRTSRTEELEGNGKTKGRKGPEHNHADRVQLKGAVHHFECSHRRNRENLQVVATSFLCSENSEKQGKELEEGANGKWDRTKEGRTMGDGRSGRCPHLQATAVVVLIVLLGKNQVGDTHWVYACRYICILLFLKLVIIN